MRANNATLRRLDERVRALIGPAGSAHCLWLVGVLRAEGWRTGQVRCALARVAVRRGKTKDSRYHLKNGARADFGRRMTAARLAAKAKREAAAKQAAKATTVATKPAPVRPHADRGTLHEFRRREGLCLGCGRVLADPESRVCIVCRQKARRYA